jgi:hypothetical protein
MVYLFNLGHKQYNYSKIMKKLMTIKEVMDKYGTNSTTNFDLIKMANDWGFKIHYAMRDEIKYLKKKKLPISIIANYQTSKESGIHHVALYKSKTESYYFDSYGIIPFKEAQDFLKHGIFSSLHIQPDGTRICGQISLFLLYKLSHGYDFYDTVLELYSYFQS